MSTTELTKRHGDRCRRGSWMDIVSMPATSDEALHQAIDDLPENVGSTVLLRAEGFSLREVARRQGIDRQRVRSRMKRAGRLLLRNAARA